MEQRIDRRTARTRKALHEALIRLTLEKDYEALTVQDIIDAADVGRSTSYAHFTGKDHLLRSGFDAFREELAATLRAPGVSPSERTLAEAGLALFAHAGEYRHVHKALVGGRGGVVVDREFRRIVTDIMRDPCPRPRTPAIFPTSSGWNSWSPPS